jgi:hypothetical protein
MSAISALKFKQSGKFDNKLDFDQRCEVLALHRIGIPRAALAEAYGIDRRTVTHIYNPKSVHYRSVRAEEEKLGREAFLKKYVTENALNKLKQVKNEAVREDAAPKKLPTRARRGSTKHAGVHIISTPNTDKDHRILIQWVEQPVDGAEPGWYFKDMDGVDPEMWMDNGPESTLSSSACLEAVRLNLVDL